MSFVRIVLFCYFCNNEPFSKPGMRLLQLSDIHFVESAKDNNRYTPIEDSFIQDIKDQHEEIPIDYVLICGDIAFSGKTEQYERAKLFIQAICDTINCPKDKVLIVPGNHDLDIEEKKALKQFIREAIADNPDDFIAACKESDEMKQVLKALYLPFKNYYAFAEEYGCISEFEKAILADSDFDLNTCFSWERELKDDGDVVARIVGVNTALLSGCAKKKKKKSNEILPEAMWMSFKKDKEHLNILMGHHPINDISKEEVISGQIDCRFHLQISGHRHIQTTNNKQLSFKITSAAFEPECVSNKKDSDLYYPDYNIIDISRQEKGYLIKDKPIVWKWSDPRFLEEDPVDFFAPFCNPTSVQTRKKKQKNTSSSEKPDQELLKIMLQIMDYDYRRQVINSTFDQPISGATENIDTIVETAASDDLMNKLYETSVLKFAQSQRKVYEEFLKRDASLKSLRRKNHK